MKKVIIATFAVIIGFLIWQYLYFYAGVIYIPHVGEDACSFKVEGNSIYVDYGNGFEKLTVKGVNVEFGKPGAFPTENAVTKEEYLQWFRQIQQLGANVIRVYSIAGKEFYDAFYEFNKENCNPLFLLQGVAIDDYLINSIYGATDKEFKKPFGRECKRAIDVLHGRYKEKNKYRIFPIHYDKDVSDWVLGYLWGSEWETNLVAYTNRSYEQLEQYNGTYLYTKDAKNFEIVLAEIADESLQYESKKYGCQKLFSFVNWAFTDPLEYDEDLKKYFRKAASVDVEHILTKENLLSGQFVSYHVYPSYPDFYSFLPVHEFNTYKQYLKALCDHHCQPVVIAEFGVPSSRAMLAREKSLGRNMGYMNERQQGSALISMYQDIMDAGCTGGIVTRWQDQWHKKTWNTMASVYLEDTSYWSDVQSCEQAYGLLAFDPGENKRVCYIDGDISEWSERDLISHSNQSRLYMKYDEENIYFLVKQDSFDMEKDRLFIPIDVTPKSGSTIAENLNISMNQPADFVIDINGKQNSRMWVQERYDTISALFYEEISAHNFFSKEFPKVDSPKFVSIKMLMQEEMYFVLSDLSLAGSMEDRPLTFSQYDAENPYHYKVQDSYETGLLTYGNGNPNGKDYNSLADFCAGENCVEVKIPWQMLNFADPVRMYIHDDYYENYGIEYLTIPSIGVGAGNGKDEIKMVDYQMKPLKKQPQYHQRLKKSYYILQDYWKNEKENIVE